MLGVGRSKTGCLDRLLPAWWEIRRWWQWPFSSRSPPMEMQPPVSPQQSECNPVGALQVCAVFSELGL